MGYSVPGSCCSVRVTALAAEHDFSITILTCCSLKSEPQNCLVVGCFVLALETVSRFHVHHVWYHVAPDVSKHNTIGYNCRTLR